VSSMKYELGFYSPEDDILHSHCRENFKSYIAFTGRRENLKYCTVYDCLFVRVIHGQWR
jgi:hypothetical protein